MRLWSIHPSFLDAKGLVANWREGLLGLSVLKNGGGAYYNHPQLNRFKETSNPVEYLSNYLHTICDEADIRGYHFDRTKLLTRTRNYPMILLTEGQLCFEYFHLMKKLAGRNHEKYNELLFSDDHIVENPFFKLVSGDIEDWEKR